MTVDSDATGGRCSLQHKTKLDGGKRLMAYAALGSTRYRSS